MNELETIESFLFNVQEYRGKDSPALIEEVNQRLSNQIKALNEKIEAYNASSAISQKMECLASISRMQQEMDLFFCDRLIAHTEKYQTLIHEKLFHQIQEQFKALDAYPKQYHSMSELLSHLSQEKINQLGKFLYQVKQSNAKSDKTHAFTEKFAEILKKEPGGLSFLEHHTISFKGGTHVLIYKVESLETGQAEIVKFEPERGYARLAEFKLKKAGHASWFVPVYALRHADYSIDIDKENEYFSSSIIVEEYCPQGDLVDELLAHFKKDFLDTDRVLDVFLQMAGILLEMQVNRVFFPDMKVDNWMVVEGLLKIADKKSLQRCDKSGKTVFPHSRNEFYGLTFTPGFQPDELTREGRENSVDKIHAYTLGINLALYITGASQVTHIQSYRSLLGFLEEQKQLTNSLDGTIFLNLIKKLITPSPRDRFSLQQTMEVLRSLEAKAESLKEIHYLAHDTYGKDYFHKLPKNICKKIEQIVEGEEIQDDLNKMISYLKLKQRQEGLRAILEQIKTFAFGEKDTKMETFYSQNSVKIYTTRDYEILEEIESELQTVLEDLNQNRETIKAIQDQAQAIRNSSGFFTFGRKAKARQIELFFSEIDITSRPLIETYSIEPLEVQLTQAQYRPE